MISGKTNRDRGRERGRGSGIADEREVVRAALETGSVLVPCCSFGDTLAFSSPLPLPSFLSSINVIISLFFPFSGRFCLLIPFR